MPTHGSEAWRLDVAVMRKINGANTQMMSAITGRSVHQEASAKWRKFDLVKWILTRRRLCDHSEHSWFNQIGELPVCIVVMSEMLFECVRSIMKIKIIVRYPQCLDRKIKWCKGIHRFLLGCGRSAGTVTESPELDTKDKIMLRTN